MAKSVNRGDIVLTQFPFTDLTTTSVRPALVVSHGPIAQDVILAAVSSVLRGGMVPSDYELDPTDAEFAGTGLRTASVIRLHKLVTVEISLLIRRLGQIGPKTQSDVDQLLRDVLSL